VRGDTSRAAAHCVTCADEGLPLRVLEVGDEGATCLGADGTVHREVAVDLVAPVASGEVLLVHAGVALRNLGPQR
jgi:hydrogenase maturation factor